MPMEDRQQPSPEEREREDYEPPAVEDLDASYGPSVTAAGKYVPTAAPRDV